MKYQMKWYVFCILINIELFPSQHTRILCMTIKTKIISFAVFFGLLLWVLDAEFHTYLASEAVASDSFLVNLLYKDLFAKIMVLVILVFAAVLIARYVDRLEIIRVKLEDTTNEMEAVFNSSPDGIAVMSNDFTILHINEKYEKYLDLISSDVIGKKCHQVCDSPNCGTLKCPNQRIIDGSSIEVYDDERTDKNGVSRTYHVVVTPTLNDQGEQTGMVANYHDVTEARTKDRELKGRMELEEMLSSLATAFLNTPTEALDTLIMSALEEICRLCGVDRSYIFRFNDDNSMMDNTHEFCAVGIEPQIDNLQDISSEMIPWWMKRLQKFEGIYIPKVTELPATRADEREILASQDIKSLLVIPLEQDRKLMGFLGFDSVLKERLWSIEDQSVLVMIGELISAAYQRKEYDDQLNTLAQRRAELEKIVNLSPVIAFRLSNEEGYPIEYISENIKRIGFSNHLDFMENGRLKSGARQMDFVHPDDRAYVSKMLVGLADGTEESIEQEFRLQAENDQVYWVNRRVWAIRDDEGKVTHFQGVTQDISARKEAEIRLASTVLELKDKNGELEDFAYIVSHDLKAPLRSIGTLSDWIDSDYADRLDDEGREQLRLLKQRVRRMHDLIDGILKYSRVGRLKEDHVRINISEIIGEVLELVSPSQAITIECAPDMPDICAERTRIKQLFENLISNAVKFMDKPEGLIRISGEERDKTILFRVEDNGPGIEEKHFDRIFKIFQTLSARDTFESTGVGLTLVKKIVGMYGGEVWLESEPGTGTVFFIEFPLSLHCSRPEGALV